MTRQFGPRIILPAVLVAVAITAAGCQPQGSVSASSSASLSATHSPKPHHTRTPVPDGANTTPATTPASGTATPGTPTPGTPTPGTPTPGTPTVTSTPPAPSPSDTTSTSPPAGTHTCVTSKANGNCGPYTYAGNTNSNGYNTYVSNNCWADPSCKQTVTAVDPGNWSVSASEPAGNGAVMTAPEAQQQFNNWCPSAHNFDNRTSANCNTSDTPISALTQLTSGYAESTPHNSQTIAQWSWDMWLSNDSGYPDEVMAWVDTNNRCNSG